MTNSPSDCLDMATRLAFNAKNGFYNLSAEEMDFLITRLTDKYVNSLMKLDNEDLLFEAGLKGVI